MVGSLIVAIVVAGLPYGVNDVMYSNSTRYSGNTRALSSTNHILCF